MKIYIYSIKEANMTYSCIVMVTANRLQSIMTMCWFVSWQSYSSLHIKLSAYYHIILTCVAAHGPCNISLMVIIPVLVSRHHTHAAQSILTTHNYYKLVCIWNYTPHFKHCTPRPITSMEIYFKIYFEMLRVCCFMLNCWLCILERKGSTII